MNEHTKGPWELFDGQITSDGMIITHQPNFGTLADGLLIASAPDLLEQLEKLEVRLTACAGAFYVKGTSKALREAFDGWKEDIVPARNTIAKAKGE